jgi:hypothetical protein
VGMEPPTGRWTLSSSASCHNGPLNTQFFAQRQLPGGHVTSILWPFPSLRCLSGCLCCSLWSCSLFLSCRTPYLSIPLVILHSCLISLVVHALPCTSLFPLWTSYCFLISLVHMSHFIAVAPISI